jgi:hypothetical protein
MTKNGFKETFYRNWYLLLIPVLGILFFLIAIKIVSPIEYPNSDFFSYWLAGHLTTLGQNPYLAEIWVGGHRQFGATWIPETTFLYPLPLALFFAPLGYLSLYKAFVVWVLLSQYMIVASIALLLKLYPTLQIKRFILPLLSGLILFRPTILTLKNGQVSGLLLLVMAAVAYLWEQEKWWQGAVLVSFFALKPNLGIPIIVLLSSYLLLKKHIVPLAVEGACGLVLLFIGLAQNPNWIIEYWGAGNSKLSQTFGYSPTVWGMTAFFCNYKLNCTVGYGIGAGLLLLIGFIYALTRKQLDLSPALAISLAILATLLVTPYTWPYDQLLLVIPIIEVTMRLALKGYKFIPTSLIFLGIDILAFFMLGISARYQVEIWNVVIPLVVFALVAWYLMRNRQGPGLTMADQESEL